VSEIRIESEIIKQPLVASIDSGRLNILSLTLKELEEKLVEYGAEKFRAKQLWNWLYVKGESDFSKMSNLGGKLLNILHDNFMSGRPRTAREHNSIDGTTKWLGEFEDANKIELVFIPSDDRGTLCMSSQVGCTLSCSFCHTGTQKLVRNLEAGEIVGQYALARDKLGDWNNGEEGRRLSNIVMMGMGEPLFNYDNVAKALQIITDKDGMNISRRKITLSTSGVVPRIEQCGEELGVNLAVSLHAVRDDLRNILVPLNRKWNIAALLDACSRYPKTGQFRRITFEYVMLKDVNDSDEEAHELARLVSNLHAKINLIPFNAWPGAPYECSSNNRMHKFAEILGSYKLNAPLRTPRGRDILAACGQLKSDSETATNLGGYRNV